MFQITKKQSNRLVLAICFLIALSVLVPGLRGLMLEIIVHPSRIVFYVSREVKGFVFFHHNMLQAQRLERENLLLKQNLYSCRELMNENERLDKLLGFKKQAAFKVVPAKVIGRSADSWTSVVMLDRGASSGFKRGMIVVSYLGVVGRITDVSLTSSKVLLLNDPQLGLSAIVQRSRQEGLVSGTLGSNLIMRYLPESAEIETGDSIETSGLNPDVPKGILIGSVQSIGNEFSGLSKFAIIKSAVNFSNIEEVLVVVQPN